MAALFPVYIDNFVIIPDFEHKDLQRDRYCSNDEFWLLVRKWPLMRILCTQCLPTENIMYTVSANCIAKEFTLITEQGT